MYVPGIKKSNFVVVPWYNRHEWEKTYQNLFSTSPKDQAAGLGAVAAWRSRLYGHLPRAIESTAALVQAQLSDSRSHCLQDGAAGVGRLNPEELSSLYAVAIVRFVGNIVEPVRGVKNITTKEAAFQLGVPDWILELRHASAHASVSGAASLGILRSAASLLLQWLRLHHWEPQRDTLVVATEASAMLHSTNGNDAIERACCSPTQVRQMLDVWLLVSVKRKCTRRQMAELKKKRQACLDQIAAFAEEDSDLVVDMLVTGGDYLLPSRDSLDELCPNIRAGSGSDQSSSSAPSTLNVTRLLKAAMDSPMEYSTKAITVLSQHMWPQLSEAELGHLTALAAIQGGLMVGRRWDATDNAEEEAGGDGNYVPYTVEDFQGSEDGFDEPAWKLPQAAMEWSDTPVGQLPGFPADRLDLNLDFKELRPIGAPSSEEARLGSEQGSAEASANREDAQRPTLADQLEHISQNVQLFVV
ncbi:uncharacterized protein LOC119395622 isoform X3 [Rhipicephalus sanguineus]|uniref:uncharacterized protein LOC119395622 isoform X3 n=1 Tax=Rhipicephalus sanguineus TaxID=34632 RepID=UPI001894CAD6|nr:uncharacterized protein LOC119395622 isoform X3 [Rhipicephalus sanguineus]